MDTREKRLTCGSLLRTSEAMGFRTQVGLGVRAEAFDPVQQEIEYGYSYSQAVAVVLGG